MKADFVPFVSIYMGAAEGVFDNLGMEMAVWIFARISGCEF